jgi:hypothetical protein
MRSEAMDTFEGLAEGGRDGLRGRAVEASVSRAVLRLSRWNGLTAMEALIRIELQEPSQV